jgi:hypothetical protein
VHQKDAYLHWKLAHDQKDAYLHWKLAHDHGMLTKVATVSELALDELTCSHTGWQVEGLRGSSEDQANLML